jgi:hypothetical protein
LRKYGDQGTKLKEIHKDNKNLALRRVAEKNIDALQENIKNKFKERLVNEDGSKREVVDNDRDKIIENRRNKETDDLATTLKMIEKRQKKELKKKENDYIEKKLSLGYGGKFRNRYTPKFTKTQERIDDEKRLRQEFKESIKDGDPNDTVLENLIKREYAVGGRDFTLKYARELDKVEGVDVKQALFENAKKTFVANVDIKNAFDNAVLVASDSVATSDSTAVTDTENVASVKDEPKSNFDKNRIIASIMYNSIADKEFNNLKNQFHIPIEDPKADGKTKRRGRVVDKMQTIVDGDEDEDE